MISQPFTKAESEISFHLNRKIDFIIIIIITLFWSEFNRLNPNRQFAAQDFLRRSILS